MRQRRYFGNFDPARVRFGNELVDAFEPLLLGKVVGVGNSLPVQRSPFGSG
jgi:hypothetical protein